jgi:hypothetical protein
MISMRQEEFRGGKSLLGGSQEFEGDVWNRTLCHRRMVQSDALELQ